MRKNKLMAVAVGIMCLLLASCSNAGNTGETVYDAVDGSETGQESIDGNATGYEVIDWKDDPTIGRVQAGCYKRVGIVKKDETYEEMLELQDIGNKGELIVRDDGTATFELDGEKTEYLYDEFDFYLADAPEKTGGIPYVYIGGRLVTNDGTTLTQYLKSSDE